MKPTDQDLIAEALTAARAFVAAVIKATGASDIFTQDLEDMRENSHSEPVAVQTEVRKESSEDEAARLFPVATPEEEETTDSDSKDPIAMMLAEVEAVPSAEPPMGTTVTSLPPTST